MVKKTLVKNFFKRFSHVLLLIAVLMFALISSIYYTNFRKNEIQNLEKLLSNTYLQKTINSVLSELNPRYQTINYQIKPGDSISKILDQLKVPAKEKKIILQIVSKDNKLAKINQYQNIKIKIDNKFPKKILKLTIEVTKTKNINFTRNLVNDKFEIKEVEKKLTREVVYKESKIVSSLYSTAIDRGIKPNVIIDFARIYGFQIDFQRDIWKNDSFEIIFENYLNDKSEIVETGKILFANLILQGREHPLYFFENKKTSDHFDENGQSIRKTLMKTPINGARLSSSFGKRKHPILGFTKMHRGTDFAAPKGTPIMAAGDGKVTRARWCGGGGNCVKIKHNSTYSTLYAHMSKFGRGIKKGAKVKQGQIIGYVGSTGLSTGPHLHYEVIENGKKINSQKMKLPSGIILRGEDRKKFEIAKIKINVLKSKLISATN
tara:strand:- start:259 stop:1560 length:1302 start_codon:yes stop_codon:yes gene_type:complete